MSRSGDSQDALRAVWMEGYTRGLSAVAETRIGPLAAELAYLVRLAFATHDEHAMSAFGNNAPGHIANQLSIAASRLESLLETTRAVPELR